MKKIFLPTSFVCLLTFFFAFSSFKAKSSKATVINSAAVVNTTKINSEENKLSVEAVSNMIYDSLQLDNLGLPREVMELAYKGQQELIERGELNNEDLIAIADFSQSSSKKRLYIIDTRNYRIVYNTYVAHGSLQSSLGFYKTKGTYFGKHGLSLKLDGLEQGFNDKAEERAIVMHGAEYIGSNRAEAAYMGRSFGCPAVPQAQSAEIINILKNGSCLFIYHPTQKYLNASKILNA